MSNTRPRFHYPRERNAGDRRVVTALCGAKLNDLYRVATEGVDCCDCRVKLRNSAINSARQKGMSALANRLASSSVVASENLLRRAARAVGWKPDEHGQ